MPGSTLNFPIPANTDHLLIIGSGPSVETLPMFNLDRFMVCCLNNAWQKVPLDKMHVWCKSNDFESFNKGRPIPPFEDIYLKINGGYFFANYWRKFPMTLYEEPEGTPKRKTTIFLDLLHELTAAPKNIIKSIWFVGCEHDYSGKVTHFYGDGKADPLRFGEEWLLHMFKRFRTFADDYGMQLVNATGNYTGLLHRGMFQLETTDLKHVQ